jgi:hypothetical protein
VHSADTAIISLVFKMIGVIVFVILISLVLLLSSCQTPAEPEPCPICQEPSLAEIEVCEIEKAELTQKLGDCLDRLYMKKRTKKGKR